jgi:hypothetical protein
MRGSSTVFFADEADLQVLLPLFRGLGDFKYTEMTSRKNHVLITYADPLELATHVVSRNAPERGAGFLITGSSESLVIMSTELADGSGIRHSLSGSLNPDSARIALGGDAGDQTLVASVIDTLGETERARAIHALFKKVVIKAARRVAGHLILPGAYQKLLSGWRLTEGKTYHRGLDVPRPDAAKS